MESMTSTSKRVCNNSSTGIVSSAGRPLLGRGPSSTYANLLALVLGLGAVVTLPACDKSGKGGETKTAETVDPTDASMEQMLNCFDRKEHKCVQSISSPELYADLGEAHFAELCDAFHWLGSLRSREVLEKEPLVGGERRKYLLKFEKGEVTIDFRKENLMVLGFDVSGPGWEAAQKGAEFDKWNRFDVFEFQWLLESGEPNPGGAEFSEAERIDYAMVVGGLGELNDLHNVSVSSMLIDASGKNAFYEPITFDVAFPSEGLPRGRIVGNVIPPKSGTYKLKITVRDNVSMQSLDHEIDVTFEKATPGKGKGKGKGKDKEK